MSRQKWIRWLLIFIGAFGGIAAVAYLDMGLNLPMLIASFGATAVLVYGVPDSPLAQTKNVLGGHVISALVGVTIVQLMGCAWYSVALAVALAIVLMDITSTTHPPGGATAIVSVLGGENYWFVLCPVLIGAVILVLWGKLIYIFRKRNQERDDNG